MGACCGHQSPTIGSNDSLGVNAIGLTVERQQAQILRPIKGTKMASARIRRGDILAVYSFESKVLGEEI